MEERGAILSPRSPRTGQGPAPLAVPTTTREVVAAREPVQAARGRQDTFVARAAIFSILLVFMVVLFSVKSAILSVQTSIQSLEKELEQLSFKKTAYEDVLERAHDAALSAQLLGAFTAVQQSLGLAEADTCTGACVVETLLDSNGTLFDRNFSTDGAVAAAPPLESPEVAFHVCQARGPLPSRAALRSLRFHGARSWDQQQAVWDLTWDHRFHAPQALFPAGLPPRLAAAEEEKVESIAFRVERMVAGLVAASIFLGPWVFLRSADKMTYQGSNVSKLLAYRMDIWFTTHSQSKVIVLLALTVALVVAGAAGLLFASGEPFTDELWNALEGAGIDWQFAGAENRTTPERVVAALISVGGMLVTALMMGIVSDTIGSRMDELRKGKSEVLESGHILILGWSDKLLPLVHELMLAHQKGTVVILAEREKEEMEDEVSYYLEHAYHEMADEPSDDGGGGGTHYANKVVCRKGSAVMVKDLLKVSAHKARGIIVLHEGGADEEAGDAKMLRAVLALSSIREGERAKARVAKEVKDGGGKGGVARASEGPKMGKIVVELMAVNNMNLVTLLGGSSVEIVVSRDFIGRLMLLCARQPGLALVFEDLLGFDKSEFHRKCWPQLAGCTFGEVLGRFEDACPLGVRVAAAGFSVLLNPPDSYVLQPTDELVVLAEEEDSYEPLPAAPSPALLPPLVVAEAPEGAAPEKALFCGWRPDMAQLIATMDEFAPPGSELVLLNSKSVEERAERLLAGGFDEGRLRNITVKHALGDPINRKDLGTLPLDGFKSIIVLADRAHVTDCVQQDSKTLASLLLIRDVQAAQRGEREEKEARRKMLLGKLQSAAKAAAMLKRMATPMGFEEAEEATPAAEEELPLEALRPDERSWLQELKTEEAQAAGGEVVAEVLDIRTKSLITETRIGEYVMSVELVAKALAQVVEDSSVNAILHELFSGHGNEVCIRRLSAYVQDELELLSFSDLAFRARQRGEIMIGWRLTTFGHERACLNPKGKRVRLNAWNLKKDVIVVLAQRDKSGAASPNPRKSRSN